MHTNIHKYIQAEKYKQFQTNTKKDWNIYGALKIGRFWMYGVDKINL